VNCNAINLGTCAFARHTQPSIVQRDPGFSYNFIEKNPTQAAQADNGKRYTTIFPNAINPNVPL